MPNPTLPYLTFKVTLFYTTEEEGESEWCRPTQLNPEYEEQWLELHPATTISRNLSARLPPPKKTKKSLIKVKEQKTQLRVPERLLSVCVCVYSTVPAYMYDGMTTRTKLKPLM